MIFIERTINIKNNQASIEEPIVLYKGDKNIELQFTINNNPFKYKSGVSVTYSQLVIKRPSADPIFSEIAKLSSGKVLFVVTGDMIDELHEVGDYDFQIRLINADKTSRATIPSVTAGIIIKEPLCEDPDNIATVNESTVNDAIVPASDEILDVFNRYGEYIKTAWKDGDTITDAKLNKIEDALYEINGKEVSVEVDLSHLATKEDLLNKADIDHIHDNYATKTYVDDMLGDIESLLGGI